MDTKPKVALDPCSDIGHNTYNALTAYNFKIFNAKMENGQEGDGSCFMIPGLSFTCFNRLGIPAVWMVANELDMPAVRTRKEDLETSYVNDTNIELQGTFRVLVAHKLLLMPSFYKKAALKCPMKLRYRIKLVTNKISEQEQCFYDKTGDLLVRSKRAVMFVNFNTRKPAETPDSIRNPNVYKPNGKGFRVKPQSRPISYFSYQVSVAHSDSDINAHLTHSAFIKYAVDAASEATHKGYFTRFTGDFFRYPVKQVEIAHKGEGFVGDILTVSVWESQTCSDLMIHFLIENKGKTVCFGEISFYPVPPATKNISKL